MSRPITPEPSLKKPQDPDAEKRRQKPWQTIRMISRHRWLYLPRLFSRSERIRLGALIGATLIAFFFLADRTVLRLTVSRPEVDGVLREGVIGEPRFINPIYASGDVDRDIVRLVFSGLTRYDTEGNIAMDLAEAVEIGDNGKTYTARLRPDIFWHDGEPVTVDDVVFTVKVMQDPEYKSPLRPNWQGVAVERIGDTAVRFTLRQPYAPFMENLGFGILPEHLWRKIPREAAVLSDLNLKPVGSGPYRFKKFMRREDGVITSFSLERNRAYHREGPYLEEIRFIFFRDPDALTGAYRRSDIDAFAFRSAAGLAGLENLDLNIHRLKLPKIFAAFLNSSIQPALGRKAVRTALAMAIDRQKLIADTASGGGVMADAAIPSGTFGAASDITAIPYDPERAKNLLASDGWKDADKDGTLERTEGSGRNRKTTKLELRVVTSDAPELEAAANFIGDAWRAIGIKVEVDALPIADLEATMIRPRAYEVLVFGEVFGHDPDPLAFWHTSQLKDPGLNIALYSNRAADHLLEEARKTGDHDARRELYLRFQKLVSDDIGAIFLYQPTNYYAVRRTFSGVELGTLSLLEERFADINLWHTDTRRALK